MSADRLDLAAALAVGSAVAVVLAALGLILAGTWRADLPEDALDAAQAVPLSTGPAGRGVLVPGGAHPAVPLAPVPGLGELPAVVP